MTILPPKPVPLLEELIKASAPSRALILAFLRGRGGFRRRGSATAATKDSLRPRESPLPSNPLVDRSCDNEHPETYYPGAG